MSDAAEIKADLELTRSELAATVDELRAKLDVKAQAKHQLHEQAERAVRAARENQRAVLVAAGAVLALVTLRALLRRAD